MSRVKSVLGSIFSRSETPTPRLIFLTDTVEVCGRGLLYALVRAHLCAATSVHYLTTSHSPEHIKHCVKDGGTPGKLHLHDGATDPCGWDNSEPLLSLSLPLPQIFRNIHNRGGERKVALVLDRVEDLVNHQDSLELIRGLHVLSAGDSVEQVVVYCGRDVVPESTLSALCHLAAATVDVLPTQPCSCRVVLRKPSGKIIKVHEEFSLTPELQIEHARPAQKKETPCGVASSDPDNILAAQTTFSLGLTDDQRMAKNSLLLPHTRVQTSGGQIHYTPDDVDDWDEDDPDDDLDI